MNRNPPSPPLPGYATALKLARATMLNLDMCKALYLKSTLGVSRHTSKTFVLALTTEQTLCKDLKNMG